MPQKTRHPRPTTWAKANGSRTPNSLAGLAVPASGPPLPKKEPPAVGWPTGVRLPPPRPRFAGKRTQHVGEALDQLGRQVACTLRQPRGLPRGESHHLVHGTRQALRQLPDDAFKGHGDRRTRRRVGRLLLRPGRVRRVRRHGGRFSTERPARLPGRAACLGPAGEIGPNGHDWPRRPNPVTPTAVAADSGRVLLNISASTREHPAPDVRPTRTPKAQPPGGAKRPVTG